MQMLQKSELLVVESELSLQSEHSEEEDLGVFYDSQIKIIKNALIDVKQKVVPSDKKGSS